ncbi:Ubiquinone biosynthesis O-methyltransferase [compost metagenome]
MEIGSGFGAFLQLLKNNDIQGKGLELNPNAVSRCVEEMLNVEEKLIQEEANENPEFYDVVCCYQVLEHIADPNSFIHSSIQALKIGGKLIIGVPNNNPYLFVNDKYHTLNLPPHHAGLWNKKSLKSLEKVFSLKQESIEFEPLEVSYSYFIDFQIRNLNNYFIFKKGLVFLNKLMPRVLKKVICKLINGRNMLVVYRKI